MATLGDLSAQHIAQAGTVNYEPQRINNFIFECVPPGQDAAAKEIIQLSVRRAPMVNENNEPIEVHYLNEKVFVAGKVTFETGELELSDFIDRPTADVIMRWRRKVYDPETGKIGLAAEYKVNASVLLYGPNGEFERQWDLIGCWPQAVNYSQGLDYSSGEVNLITVTMQFDKAKAKNYSLRAARGGV